DAGTLPHARPWIFEVVDAEVRDGQVELAVPERQGHGVSRHEARRAAPMNVALVAGAAQRGPPDVDAHDVAGFSQPTRELERGKPRAAADVEHVPGDEGHVVEEQRAEPRRPERRRVEGGGELRGVRRVTV